MKAKNINEVYPFLSLVIVVGTLFFLVFLKMEIRKQGYAVWKLSREYKTLDDRNRLQQINYARVTRSERLRHLALTYLTLNDAKTDQVIHLGQREVRYKR